MIPGAPPVAPAASPSGAPSGAALPVGGDGLDDGDEDVDEDDFEAVDMDGHRSGHTGIRQDVGRDAFHNEHNVYHGTVQMGGSGNRATEQGMG